MQTVKELDLQIPISILIENPIDTKIPAPAATEIAGTHSLTNQNIEAEPLEVKDLAEIVAGDGWRELAPGYYSSKRDTASYGKLFRFFVRSQPLGDFLAKVRTENGEFLKNSPNGGCEKTLEISVSEAGAQPPMGRPIADCAPVAEAASHLPALAAFDTYLSLRRARSERDSLLIGFDSEWVSPPDGVPRETKDMLSWQFALVYEDVLYEFIFLRIADKGLTLELALGRILDHIQAVKPVDARKVIRYRACKGFKGGMPDTEVYDTWQAASCNSQYIYKDHKFLPLLISSMPVEEQILPRSERDWAKFHTFHDWKNIPKLSVTLICHAGKVDLSSLDQQGKGHWDILRHCSEIQGGLSMLDDSFIEVKSVAPDRVKNRHEYLYPVILSIGDTMCHAPANKKSLENLGKVLGIEKIDLGDEADKDFIVEDLGLDLSDPMVNRNQIIEDATKSHMDVLLRDDPKLFFHYASRDAEVTLLYASAIYGYNKEMAVTATSVAAKVAREDMMGYLDCKKDDKGKFDIDDFNLKYRGLKKVSHGRIPREDRPGYMDNTSLEPTSDKANTVQNYAAFAYHGGYNSCSDVGYFPFNTFDYDLENAYPTAMCWIPDIDWDNPIQVKIENRYLDIRDWHVGGGVFNPMRPMLAYVTKFEFPEDVKYPCIPVDVDGIPIYPRTSDGLNGVYVAGPELFLALQLGAKVWCETGLILNTRLHKDENGKVEESRALKHAVKQLVMDRALAKKECGKGSLEEQILKMLVNALYGKTAQNVVEKQTWSAYKESMEALGCSAVTNPVSACLITSIVRAQLLAAQNQADSLGYRTFSVTTDGFISDMPEDVLKSLDLYGFRRCMEESRLFLTDGADPEIWAIKHVQDDLVNFTTRGNVSLHDWDEETKTGNNPMVYDGKNYPGVCAHNNTRSGYLSDSPEDRHWLYKEVISSTGPVESKEKDWTKYKDLARGAKLTVTEVTKNIRMDFDMKRKPVRQSFHTDYPPIDGETYEFANFTTVPFETVEEYRMYRQKKVLCTRLRTVADWDVFFSKVELNACGNRTKDRDWAIIKSCIMGYRTGRWSIPALDGKTVAEKCEWINQHNDSTHKFKENDWKDCRKKSRIVNMLPDEFLQDKLDELMNSN